MVWRIPIAMTVLSSTSSYSSLCRTFTKISAWRENTEVTDWSTPPDHHHPKYLDIHRTPDYHHPVYLLYIHRAAGYHHPVYFPVHTVRLLEYLHPVHFLNMHRAVNHHHRLYPLCIQIKAMDPCQLVYLLYVQIKITILDIFCTYRSKHQTITILFISCTYIEHQTITIPFMSYILYINT